MEKRFYWVAGTSGVESDKDEVLGLLASKKELIERIQEISSLPRCAGFSEDEAKFMLFEPLRLSKLYVERVKRLVELGVLE